MIDDYKNKIVAFYTQHRRMPGYSELMELTGFKSKNAVYKLINRLVSLGIVIKDARGKLTPAWVTNEIPLLGFVEAGFPSPAEEGLFDTISLEEWIINRRDISFMLRVKGDSMFDAGIRDGDMVIVERTNNVKVGDIVIAEIDGQWTMKYYETRNGKPVLVPANKDYPILKPQGSLNIPAKVVAVIRKYK